MAGLVFYCANCKQTFIGEDYTTSDKPKCPNCNKKIQSFGFTKEQWLQMSKQEQAKVLDSLEEKKANRETYARSVGIAYEENVNSNQESAIDGLYTNIGRKIKTWAKVFFVLGAIASDAIAIFMLFAAKRGGIPFVVSALLLSVLGPVAAWISSLPLYAFGELVDKTSANEKNTQNILKLVLEDNAKDSDK